ncbi:hypothetical protein AA0472_2455 [Acetobacter estunensis NRIC 0472]|uniref:Uncharacterized protein n=1 Tax=Acetobacter estunensis TaxID=104097 RepID=A0A967B8Z5_9PROT|nr:hypothetical protein [Acetobacter estunensis]NHO54915.1 hypothetical protein [Acetobacter estunensis]GBQ27624.1 hypothetical protein AA0472_2455 [Acetobacter estunensis NRIC 0472]
MNAKPTLVQKVESAIRECALTPSGETPEAVSASVAIAVCRYLDVSSSDIPETVLNALKGVGPNDGEAG